MKKRDVMLEKMRGVVLFALRYKDDSFIVDIYTERHGTVPFLVHVPRSRRSALHTTLLRPLNILELDFDFRPARPYQHIKEVRLAEAYTSLPYDAMKQTVALFLSEFLRYALRHEESNEPLMQYLLMSLRWLDLAGGNISNFHIVFLLQLTRYLGIWPDVEGSDAYTYFDMQEAVLKREVPRQGYYLTPQETSLLPLFARISYGTMHLLRLTREQRARALDILVAYYRMHVAEFPELKSLDVLREVLR